MLNFFSESGPTSNVLNQVVLSIINNETCRAGYAGSATITPQIICAGSPLGGVDACQVLSRSVIHLHASLSCFSEIKVKMLSVGVINL